MSVHASANTTGDDGWIVARCTCGLDLGEVPDEETACDVLMDHAYGVGVRDGKQIAGAST